MKTSSKHWTELMLLAVGFALFLIGLYNHDVIISKVLIGTGVVLTLIFYFLTFAEVIAIPGRSQRKIFWVVALACLPVIGNLIFVIFRETADRRQKVEAPL